jgi:hypothetical protein
MLVSSTSMNAASETTKAISHGLALGFQSWSACVSVPAPALIQSLIFNVACASAVKIAVPEYEGKLR